MSVSTIGLPYIPYTSDKLTSNEATVSPNSTAWITGITPPSTWKNTVFSGYYISGTNATTCTVYACYWQGASLAMAVRNYGSNSAVIKVEAYFRHT